MFQSPRNGDDLSEGELAEPGSPEDNGNEMGQKVSSSQKEKVQINLRARLSSNRGLCDSVGQNLVIFRPISAVPQ